MNLPAVGDAKPPQILRHPPAGVRHVLGTLTALAALALGIGVWRVFDRLERIELELMIAHVFSGAVEADDPGGNHPTWIAVSYVTRSLGAAVEGAAAAYLLIAGVIGVLGAPRRAAWHLAAAGWVIVFCSLLTVLGILVLVDWAHYPKVPPETILKIALAQSAFGWLLIFSMAALRRA